jgi:hypothetical protein
MHDGMGTSAVVTVQLPMQNIRCACPSRLGLRLLLKLTSAIGHFVERELVSAISCTCSQCLGIQVG